MSGKALRMIARPRDAAARLPLQSVHLKAAARRSLRTGYSTLSRLGAESALRFANVADHRAGVAALVGAGSVAVAAGTVYAVRHSGRPFADVLEDEQPYRVSTLLEVDDDDEALALIQRELLAEWGAFAPQDMQDMQRMLRNAGRLIYVIRFFEADGRLGPPSGVLQTARVEAGGDPERLLAAFPSFDAITARGTWEGFPAMSGDTAVLLQITAFGDRSRGVGSRLRDTALYLLPGSVRFALTTTPVPRGFDASDDPESFGPTRFHFRGGARPAGYAAGFKRASEDRAGAPAGRQANEDVVFMRYVRDEAGAWQGVARPPMRLRRHARVRLPRPALAWPRRQALAA